MKRFAISTVFVSAVAIVASVYHANTHHIAAAPAAPTPAVAFGNEPVVIYSVTGGTLTGGIHRQLTVYNSGFATIAMLDTPVFPTPGEFKDVATAYVGPNAAVQLLLDLVRAGAATVPSQQIPIPDVPVRTLTVLEGREVALSRTLSYSGGGLYAGVSSVLDRFVQNTFPGF